MHVRLADESVCIGPPPARDSYLNIPALLAACEITGARRGASGLRLSVRKRALRRDPRQSTTSPSSARRPSISASWATRSRPSDTAQAARHSLVPGSDGGGRPTTTRRMRSPARSAIPVLVKAAAGGGGRGMKVARTEDDLEHGAADRAHGGEGRVRRRRRLYREIPAEAAPHRNPDLRRRHAAMPSISASATARCSAATRRCWKKAPRPALNAAQRAGSARSVANAMREIELSRRRHDRVPLRERRVLLHRDEHPHPGRASGDRDDHRHRSGAASRSASPPARRCRSRRKSRDSTATPSSAAINAENPRPSAPRPGKITLLSSARRPRRARRFRASIRATRSRPITTA